MTNPNPNVTVNQVAKAYEAIIGERFCSTCRRTIKLSLGGKWKPTASGRRWVCGICTQRKFKQ